MREDNVQMTAPSCKDTSQSSYLANGVKSGFPTQEEILVPNIATYGCLILPEQSSPTAFKTAKPNKQKSHHPKLQKMKISDFSQTHWLAGQLAIAIWRLIL